MQEKDTTKMLEHRLQKLEKDLLFMELENSWSNSWFHRGINMIFLYIAVASFMFIIWTDMPLITGLLPVVVYLTGIIFHSFCKQKFLVYVKKDTQVKK